MAVNIACRSPVQVVAKEKCKLLLDQTTEWYIRSPKGILRQQCVYKGTTTVIVPRPFHLSVGGLQY